MDNPIVSSKSNKVTDYEHLKECLRIEVIKRDGGKAFSWLKVLHRVAFNRKKRFYFWWRIANYLYKSSSSRQRKIAKIIGVNLARKYGTDISIAAHIGTGMKINHYVGIVIRAECVIGDNVNIRQNTTIGRKKSTPDIGYITIGNNVDIGANSCILGDIVIGDNVTIGAMSFINKDIPADALVYSQKTTQIVIKNIESTNQH